MVGGGPGSNSRGRGGKFKKFTRGGGKHFSRNLRPIDADGNEISMWSEDTKDKGEDGDSDSSEDEDKDSSEDEAEDAGQGTSAATQPSAGPALSREERKKQKLLAKERARDKAQGRHVKVGDMPSSDSDEEEDEEDEEDQDAGLANPNHSRAARDQAQMNRTVDEAADKLKAVKVGTPSRRERESMEAAQAKARYQKLHEAGKTDEAKADLARLRLVREKREAEAAQRSAEKEEREAQEKARRAEIEAKEAKKRAAALGTKGKKGKN